MLILRCDALKNESRVVDTCSVAYQQNILDDLLPGIEHAYNSSVHATTALAPFMMTFCQIPIIMADILIHPGFTSVECVSNFV
jgi:hypothetical protein